MKTINVVLIRRGEAKDGILKLRITENQKSVFKTLRIKVPCIYWNKEKNRVKATDKVDYKAINQKIEEIEKEYRNAEDALSKVKADGGSFLTFYSGLVSNIDSPGSAKKYKTQLTVLTDFLLTTNKKDLRFGELDRDFINNYKAYLIETRKLAPSTVVRYLKHFKTVINKAIISEVYTFPKHPFLNLTFGKEITSDKYLTKEELTRIIDLIPSDESLKNVRTKFLFSVMACGMRTSDLHLLTFGSIKQDRISYIMYKTKQHLSIKLNDNLILLLADRVASTSEAFNLANFKDFEKWYNEYHSYVFEKRSRMPATINTDQLRKWQTIDPTLDIDSRITKQEAYKNDKQLLFLKHKLIESTSKILRSLSTKHSSIFVFKGLDQDLFKSFNIYKPLKKQHSQIESKTTLYNKDLKDLQKAVQIDLNLTSHVARHTYTNLMIEIKTDIYAISKSLNHQNLSTTQTYIAKFNDKIVDNAVDNLSKEVPL